MNQPDGRGRAGKVEKFPPNLHRAPDGGQEPGWAAGLRKLYDSVVDEPLPDSFKDLLKKLDAGDDD